MTQILTLQPNATMPGSPTFGGLTIVGGGGTYHGAVGDNSDASYIEGDNTQGGTIGFNFPDPAGSLPAGGWIIESLQLRIRRSADAAAFASGQINPWWWHSYIALGDGFGASASFHNRTLSIFDTTNLSAGGTIQDGYTNLVTYLDDGTHVRSMLFGSVMQVVMGTFPTFAGTHRFYKLELLIRYNSLPVVTIGSNPADPSNSTRPVVGWTYTDADLETQQSFRVIVVEEGVPSNLFPYGVPGTANPLYNPEGAQPKAWDSGEFFSSGSSIQVGPGLVNGHTYYAFVRVTVPPAAGIAQRSRWAFKKFTVTATGPANPVLTVTADGTNSRNHIVVRESVHTTPHPARYTVERTNEDVDGWEPVRGGTYTAKARGFRTPSAGVFSGWYTLDDAKYNTLTAGFIVRWRGTLEDYTYSADQVMVSKALAAGNLLSFIFQVRTDGKLELKWSTAGSSFDKSAVSTTSASATDGNEYTFEVRASLDTNPWSVSFWRSLDGGASFLQIGSTVTGAGPASAFDSSHRIGIGGYDNFLWGQMNGLTAAISIWNKAGTTLLTNPSFEGLPPNTVEFIDGMGSTWTFNGGANGYLEMQLDIYDYEAPNGIPNTYEAQAWRDDTDIVAGAWVGSSPATVTLPDDVWYLKDPLDPANNLVVSVVSISETIGKPMTVADPLSTNDPGSPRHFAVVSHTGTRGSQLRVVFRTLDRTTFNRLAGLWRSGRTLLLQNVHGRQWYVQPGPATKDVIKAAPAIGETSPIRHAYETAMDMTEVAAPADLTSGQF